MSDERRRALERKGAVDPGARVAWLRELVRTGSPEVVRIRESHEKLEQRLEKVRAEVDRGIARLVKEKPNACPALSIAGVAKAVEAAFEERRGLDELVGYGVEALAVVAPRAVHESRRHAWMVSFADKPFHVFAFAARLGKRVVVRVAAVDRIEASPGSVWRELQPWREGLSARALRPRLEAWCRGRDAARFSSEDARLWLELVPLIEEGAVPVPRRKAKETAPVVDVIDDEKPTRGQLAQLDALVKQLALGERARRKVLKEHGGCRRLDELGRLGAEAVVAALEELAKKKGALPGADEPTPKQLGFIGTLRDRKRLDDETFLELLEKAARCSSLEDLDRRGASALINALLALD